MAGKSGMGTVEQLKNNWLALSCAGMIFFLELIAMHKGINGKCLAFSIGAIAGLGGYTVKRLLGK